MQWKPEFVAWLSGFAGTGLMVAALWLLGVF